MATATLNPQRSHLGFRRCPGSSRGSRTVCPGAEGPWVRRSQGQRSAGSRAGSSSWGWGSSAEAPGNGPRSFSCTASPHPSPVRGAAPGILYNSRFKETSVTPSAIQAQNVNPAPGTGGSKINPAPGQENPVSAQVQGHETPTLTQAQDRRIQHQPGSQDMRIQCQHRCRTAEFNANPGPGQENPKSAQVQENPT